ncbi:GumC domain-containing protein [Leptothoe spongobia]|uniref:Uncharacterized protein n=1 Tax=Leptothoe spongobia TAU-MAC 1115 TaxID=1967444 RepID=A0A947GJM4_9CYAN|nr:hypothetical protein [Leptothoe spongobia]MBT9316108.1 hypothetical protein [Leptothoe spongobia TAU-MAC 1115]
MSSLCKPANQPQPLQGLMLNGLAVYPNKQQPKQKTQRGKRSTTRSIYWTNELAISESSSPPSQYHTALALGATMVCSAGALMQYTETGLWHQSHRLIPDKTISQSQKSEPATDVTTPPISDSQTTASFSSRADGSNCKNGTCQGLESIDRHSPLQANSQALLSEMRQSQTESSVYKLQTQQAILSHRSTDLAHLQKDLEARSQQSNQQFASLTTRLAIHPEDAKQIENLLNLDTSYQVYRLRLNSLKAAIAIEYSKPVVDNPQLELLYSQYAQELAQLRQIAQNILANYIANVSVEFPDTIWQDKEYYHLLQALMDVAHRRQVHIIEYNTLTVMRAQLNQRRTEIEH